MPGTQTRDSPDPENAGKDSPQDSFEKPTIPWPILEAADTSEAALHDDQWALQQRALAPAGSQLPPARLLVVFAHPDDEVLAMGARLERLTNSRLVTLTDGAPLDGNDARHHGFDSLEAYRNARQTELHAALAHAALPASVAAPFPALPPVPDQQAACHLVALTQGLLAVLREFAPDAVLTHPYEGGHPDHDACAFAVTIALQLYEQSRAAETASSLTNPPETQVLLLEAPFYHSDGQGGMRTGEFLEKLNGPQLVEFFLSPEEQDRKRARLACFSSQAETLAQFGVEQESFRVAQPYDFTQPPHAGKLLYEHFDWGMDGPHFRSLVKDALTQLCPSDTPGVNQDSPRADPEMRPSA